MANQASWIPAPTKQVSVGPAETYTPGPNELLVKINSVAFTPIEAKIQKFGTHPIPYPNILGTSFSGTVESVGEGVTGFEKGDHVASIRSGKTLADPRFGGYQKFALAPLNSASKIPKSVPFHSSSATIINLAAITSALSIHLGLERPPLSGTASPKGKKVLIYGGSSSCGGLAVKYAATAGYEVVTTSSNRNKDFVQSLGPATIIDHEQAPADVVADLKKYGPYDAVLDTIGLPAPTAILVEYFESLGGGAYNTMIPPIPGTRAIPDNVKRIFAPYSFAFDEPQHKPLAQWLYEEYLPKGLESGLIVPTRQHVLTGGLEKAQEALDLMNQGGVSGKKLVLDPWEATTS
ncbi:GroES-like protein [Bimuria novae-zelandiae CBS 107.79]|uniref:GroES-like protein n=1 Tax=Bimuria novae-zelandiae CBS 107.79 TaxID=1447943 RepID=A0A6A5VKF2_9PLEO|nr:GroES-like protein [Bimuria novae-zelandiae CBS 107.79]